METGRHIKVLLWYFGYFFILKVIILSNGGEKKVMISIGIFRKRGRCFFFFQLMYYIHNRIALYVSLLDISVPRNTIFGERFSPVPNVFMAHTYDSGFTTRLWTKHPGSNSLDIVRCDLVYLVRHFSYGDFSIINQDL